MDDNNLNHLIAVNVLVPRVASESSRLSVCEAERDEARKALAESQEREGSLNRCIDALEDRGVAREGELMALENVAVDLADARAQRDALAAAIEKHRKWAGECADVYDCELYAALAAALSGVIPAPPDGMTLLDQTRLLLVGEKEHAIHWREYAAQVQDDRHRLAEALRWLLTSATSGPLRTAGPAQFYDAQVGLHAVEKARAALALYQDVGQDAEEQERRYERMMRERGFVSAADLCDPDWDEPSDGDTEAGR